MPSDDFKEFISQPDKKSAYPGTACFFTLAHLVLMTAFAALMLYYVPVKKQIFMDLHIPLPEITRLILAISQLGWSFIASLFVLVSGMDGFVLYLSSRNTENYKGISITYLILVTILLLLGIAIIFLGVLRPLQLIQH